MPRKPQPKADPNLDANIIKTTVYGKMKYNQELYDALTEENRDLGLNPRDRRSDKAGKTSSDLYVTLGEIWLKNPAVRLLVRAAWGLGKATPEAQGHGSKGKGKA
jgi:hypothetical protein